MDRVAALEESTAKAKEDEETARRRAMSSALYETAPSQPEPQPKPQPNPPVPEVPPAETPAPPSGGSTAGGPPEEEGPTLGGVARGAVGYTFTDESDPAKVRYERTESGFKALTGPYAGREFYHGTKPGTALSLAEKGDYGGLKRMAKPATPKPPTQTIPATPKPLTPIKASDALLDAMMGLEKGSEEYNRALKQLKALKEAGQ